MTIPLFSLHVYILFSKVDYGLESKKLTLIYSALLLQSVSIMILPHLNHLFAVFSRFSQKILGSLFIYFDLLTRSVSIFLLWEHELYYMIGLLLLFECEVFSRWFPTQNPPKWTSRERQRWFVHMVASLIFGTISLMTVVPFYLLCVQERRKKIQPVFLASAFRWLVTL